jgi:hypothetical protein
MTSRLRSKTSSRGLQESSEAARLDADLGCEALAACEVIAGSKGKHGARKLRPSIAEVAFQNSDLVTQRQVFQGRVAWPGATERPAVAPEHR